ncbi:MAG: NPCBM/NEW2 domain-containing protein [Planctomycetes bacterium]|nr:NPCBM/NEW2 domain-containing protein [Planctomycetota bacterium]
MRPPGVLAFLGLLLPCLPAAAGDIQVLDVHNKTYAARQVALEDSGDLALSLVDGGTAKVPCDEVAEVAFPRLASSRKAGQVQVILSNHDLLVGDLAGGTKSALSLKSPDLGVIDCLLEQVQRLVFPGNKSTGKAPEPRPNEDVLWRSTGDTDVGAVTGIEADGIRFQSSLFKREVRLDPGEIAMILFSELAPPPDEPEGMLAIVECARGSRLTGKLTSLKPGAVTLTTLYGNTLSIPVGSVASIFFKNGRCVYLSDLVPAKVVEYDYFPGSGPADGPGEPLYPFQKDRGLQDARRISVKGKEYRKGLAVHSYCELTYALDGKFKRFLSAVGFEDQAEPPSDPPGPLRFAVLADGKKLFDSGPLKWESKPAEVDVPVEGVKELRIVCDFGGDILDGNILGRGAWAGARLIR